MKRHNLSIHEGVKYPCQFCEHKATNPKGLNSHIQSVHEGRRFKCEISNLECRSRGNLWMHSRVHKERAYKCTTCDAKFTVRGSLTNHIKSKHFNLNFKV